MTDKKKPASRDWPEVVKHAHHVRTVLIDNGKTASTSEHLDALLDKYYRGIRTSSLKASIEIVIIDLIDRFSWLFIEPDKKEPADV